MTIPFPTPQWPSVLLEVGPEADRAILLRGTAEIAGALYDVIAIRMDPISMTADFRTDLPRQAYAGSAVQDILEDLAGHVEMTDAALVHLPPGGYVMLMIPAVEGTLD
ncbi:MAG TPA: hypothetical protein VH023_16230 [Rhodopila sp.]|jgi:hypothetical protein|nr:hypothetical protein [Rhodopila sp.]